MDNLKPRKFGVLSYLQFWERVGKREFSVAEILKPRGFREQQRVHLVELLRRLGITQPRHMTGLSYIKNQIVEVG